MDMRPALKTGGSLALGVLALGAGRAARHPGTRRENDN
jgi:hypothetical protein